ncbi:MAG: protein kinase domain-containing protein [Gemmatimonas sp.]|nr:protein kinase [Gemmatimonadaceae bacterium]
MRSRHRRSKRALPRSVRCCYRIALRQLTHRGCDLSDLLEQLRVGLANYAIERELGRGGMATVFLAQDLRHGRPVALKVLHPELAASLGPERFQREIRVAARLQHPHILTVHDSGVVEPIPGSGGTPAYWFTMPYVEGESLRSRLDRERQLPIDQALQIAREAARALDYAHQHGVIHRDIKPENILLTEDGSTLVADFGIARALVGEEGLTQTGIAIGTPAYMSPEQASADKSTDARTDTYALGAVLYEMLAGEQPYTGATAQAVILKRFTEPVPSVRTTRPNVPESVDVAIQRALAPVPADRFASAAEFARAIGSAATSAATAATPPVPSAERAAAAMPSNSPEPGPIGAARIGKRPRVPVFAAALIVGFLLGLGVLFAWRQSRVSTPANGARVLAVLPFENLGDSANAYLADGITNELRGKLSELSTIQVIARGSSAQYRHTTKTPQEIARELGADYLLTATVQWEKRPDGTSRVRVSPELVDVSEGRAPRTKWQQPFDASITDVFQVQADIANQVASALDVALGSGQRQTLTEKPTANLAAYDAYLKGEATQGLIIADANSLKSAITYYEQAVALDSSFAKAWTQLSRAHSAYYFNAFPSPASAAAAKQAVEHALALAPGKPETQLAYGEYQEFINKDLEAALVSYKSGIRLAPEDPDLLTSAALAEQSLGRWDEAEKNLERGRTIDPRSPTTSRRLAQTLLRLRRYPEGMAEVDRSLKIAPSNLDLLECKVMLYLAQGDLESARNVIRSAPPTVEPTGLVAYFGNYWDLAWVLDDPRQQLLLRLTPSAFDGDRGSWGIVLAQTYYFRGDHERARIYADSARIGFEQSLASAPNDAQRHVINGLALAYAGRKAEAEAEGERGVSLLPSSKDNYVGSYIQHQLARIYILTGNQNKAMDQLEPLLKTPYFLSPAWLRIDPNFAPLKGNPRFERLIATK